MFSIDISSCFPFRVHTYGHILKVTDATDHPSHGSAITGIGELAANYNLTINNFLSFLFIFLQAAQLILGNDSV